MVAKQTLISVFYCFQLRLDDLKINVKQQHAANIGFYLLMQCLQLIRPIVLFQRKFAI